VKKVSCLVMVVFFMGVFLPSLLQADSKHDIQTIKKAVKKNPEYKKGEEAKWFKVLITNNETKEDEVKITLPVCLVETVLECVDEDDLEFDRDECDIDIKELFKELKKLGPAVLIEVYKHGKTIKVWLE
jgi:hypothetical protein